MIANPTTSSSTSWPSANQPLRQAGRRFRRSEGRKWESKSSTSTAMVCLLVVACSSTTTCLSFTMPRHRTHFLRTDGQPRGSLTASSSAAPKNPIFTSLFSEATDNGSTDNENVSRKSENPKIVVDDGEDSQMRNLAFDDVAESPAPPLNYEKYLTMQKKRVPVTIRYSRESGLKPYYLTVAKRVKDQYPDVLIERIEVSGDDDNGNEVGEGEKNNNIGTFEVVVDGKIVVRTDRRAGTHAGSIFVSMTEMDQAIARARKRRRPSTMYGEKIVVAGANDDRDVSVKSRLEFLKQKAMELQRDKVSGNNPSNGAE